MIPLGSLNLALARAFEAATKPLDGYEWRDGKLVPIKRRQSVSARIRQRKSTKQRPTKRIKGSQAP